MTVMDIADTQFRIGLIIAVIVLGSVFAGAIFYLVDEDGSEDGRKVADALSDAIASISASGTEGSVRIDLARTGEGVRIPPTIGGKGYSLRIAVGLMTIEHTTGKEIVSDLENILPCHRPIGGAPGLEDLKGLKPLLGEVILKTPCTIVAEHVSINGSSYLFVHDLAHGYPEMASDLIDFMEYASIPMPGYLEEVKWEGDCIFGGRCLLIAEGTLPHPVLVNPSFEVRSNGPALGVRATRESRMGTDGNLTVIRTLMAS